MFWFRSYITSTISSSIFPFSTTLSSSLESLALYKNNNQYNTKNNKGYTFSKMSSFVLKA